MSAEWTSSLKPVHAGEAIPGWVVATEFPREGEEASRQAEEAVEGWVFSLLEQAALPREECLWTGWNPFRLQLPTPWRPGDAGPLAGAWREVRFFHERLEIRLQRTRWSLALRLLTEDEGIRQAAQDLVPECFGQEKPTAEDFQTLPGHLFLVGRPIDLGPGMPEGIRGEVRYPRLVRYETPRGPVPAGSGERVRVAVMRYFDPLFRLRAVRYRSLEA